MENHEYKGQIKQKVYKDKQSNYLNMNPGNPKGLPDESFHFQNTIGFIDEAFLSKLAKHFGKGKYIKFDRYSFAENIAKKQRLKCEHIFLYTAPPFQSPKPTKEEEKKREGYDKFIYKLKEKGIQVKEGRCQRLKIDGKFEYYQKAVDVLLAMDLTNVSFKFPKIKKIILISSDSDFVPVIKNLSENSVKTILYTYYEKGRKAFFSTSNELIKSVHKYVLITKEDFTNATLDKGEIGK
ncbi:NYN domain-containing protein [Candidatus Pacearchaeota archaeon]|nr:NYN domain-containing protein [Candidatus Pacearchaeota archaeon]